MVTGIEVAGLVVGSLPLLIEFLDRYRKGLEKTRAIAGIRKKDRKRLTTKVDGLIKQLNWLQSQLNIHLKRLILMVNPNQEIETLPQDYKNDLWAGPIGDQVDKYLKRLGNDDTVTAFKGALSNYQDICIEIAENIEGIIRPPEADKGDLKALCDLRGQGDSKLRFAQRFGFTLNEEGIDRLTRGLEEKTRSIGSFVDSSADLDRLVTQANTYTATKQHNKSTKYLYSTRKHAYSLFLALNKVWKRKCEHVEHNVLLHLDSRCMNQHSSLPTDVPFHVLFRWLPETGTETFWQESAIVPNTDSIVLPEPSTNPNTPKILLNTKTKTIGQGFEVATACESIVLANKNGEAIYFHLSDDKRLYSSKTVDHQHAPILPTEPKLISLHTYLLSKHRKVLVRKRMELAIKLASSVLQYNETHWFQQGWQKDRIFFFEDKDTFSSPTIDIDHPLILEPFPATNLPTNWPDPEDTLLELAILLMELYHRTGFENWMTENHPAFDQRQLSDVDFKRTFASKWYKKMPRGADFHDVVGVCLWPHQLQQFESTWEDDDFRCAFYVHVICPLLAY